MKAGAIALFVGAGILAVYGTRNVFFGESGKTPGGEFIVSYAVGSYLPSMVLLIAGLILWKKGAKKKVADVPPQEEQRP
jgi:hypothetical protein